MLKTCDSVPTQEVAAATHGAGNLDFHGALGKPQATRRFALGDALEFPQDKDLAATRREGLDGIREKACAFIFEVRGRRIDALIGQFPYIGNEIVPLAAHRIDREAPGDLKEERLCRSNGMECAGFPNAEIGFLHDIVDIANGRIRTAEERLERSIVRVHRFRKPTRLLAVSR